MGFTMTTSSSKSDSKSKSHSEQVSEQSSRQESQQYSEQQQQSQSTSQQQSTTQQQNESQSYQASRKTLDTDLANQILSGLLGGMTEEQMREYAANLLMPQLNAGLEAAQQSYDTAKLTKEQQIEELAATLARNIQEQQSAYGQNMADVEKAALARGMGRSSYTLQQLAAQGNKLAQVVQQMTDETSRQQGNLQEQIALAGQQNAETQGRLKTDYAANLAAKVQELTETQRREYNQNYLTAISSALGQETTGQSTSIGTQQTQSQGTQQTTGSSTTQTQGSALSETVGKATTDTTGEEHSTGWSESVTTTGGGGGSKKSGNTNFLTSLFKK